jgi:hypothetical protein
MPRNRTMTGRDPFELFLVAITMLTAVPVITGSAPASGSVLAAADKTFALIWSWVLLVGGFATLLGLLWPQPRDRTRVSVNGYLIEQVGLIMVSAGSLFFAVALFVANGFAVLQVGGIVLAYGAACARQAWRIQRMLHGGPPASVVVP